MTETPGGWPYPEIDDPVREGDNVLADTAQLLEQRTGEYVVKPASTNGTMDDLGWGFVSLNATALSDQWLILTNVMTSEFRRYRLVFYFENMPSNSILAYRHANNTVVDEGEYYNTARWAMTNTGTVDAAGGVLRSNVGLLTAKGGTSHFGKSEFGDTAVTARPTQHIGTGVHYDPFLGYVPGGTCVTRTVNKNDNSIRLTGYRYSAGTTTFGFGNSATGWVKVYGIA